MNEPLDITIEGPLFLGCHYFKKENKWYKTFIYSDKNLTMEIPVEEVPIDIRLLPTNL